MPSSTGRYPHRNPHPTQHPPRTRPNTPQAGTRPLAQPDTGLARRLRGVRRITLALPGVLLAETTPSQLEEGAALLDGVASVIARLLQHCELFLLCRVESDVGEAAVRGVLEGEGVCGTGKGQVPPHRVLFCGTAVGSTSMVRQLEPDLHIDGDAETVGLCCVWSLPTCMHVETLLVRTGARAAAVFATVDVDWAREISSRACRVPCINTAGVYMTCIFPL